MKLSALVLLLLAAPAWGQIQTHGKEEFPGNNELSVFTGYQAGFSGTFGNPSGFKLMAEFAHGFSQIVWLDVQLNQTFGFGGTGTCFDRFGNPFPCGGAYNGGWATELAVGVKLKFKTGIPLVVEVPITAAFEILYDRACGDNGVAAPVIHPGVRAMYFLTRKIGVGVSFNFALGPGFHGGGCGQGSYVDLFGAFDASLGAEFIL